METKVEDKDVKEESSSKDMTNMEVDEIESAKAEMGQVQEENERLKTMLKQIEGDYESLKSRFLNFLKQGSSQSLKRSSSLSIIQEQTLEKEEHRSLVSLSIGRSSIIEPKKNDVITRAGLEEDDIVLGLDLSGHENFNKPNLVKELVANSASCNDCNNEDLKEEALGETWPPSKILKMMKNESSSDEALLQNHVKKAARVSVRARCESPTMNDGCQWRKYGQKISKGNPCPRAYYRCTVSPTCPVRKQVQRCADDMSILITTYEGTHNHPLPISATSMASTTSAAASMLMNGSSASESGLGFPSPVIASSNYYASNFNTLSNNSRLGHQVYFPNTMLSSSLSAPPTITLDLTTTSSASASLLTILNSSPSPAKPSSNLSTMWAAAANNNNSQYYYYYPPNTSNKAAHVVESLSNNARQCQDANNNYQSFTDKNINTAAPFEKSLLTETLTKAITTDPSFRSVIAAALTTLVGGNNGTGVKGNQGGGG